MSSLTKTINQKRKENFMNSTFLVAYKKRIFDDIYFLFTQTKYYIRGSTLFVLQPMTCLVIDKQGRKKENKYKQKK